MNPTNFSQAHRKFQGQRTEFRTRKCMLMVPLALAFCVLSTFAQPTNNGVSQSSTAAMPATQPAPCPNSPLPNVNQLALLRWYDANLTATFAVGGNPNGMAFDGSNVWVVNQSANSVTKIRVGDGAVLGTFPVGTVAGYAAFDGANVWVTNLVDDTVSKLRASALLTQILAPSNAIPRGALPAGNVPSRAPSQARSSVTSLLPEFVIQTSAPSNAMKFALWPTGNVPILWPSFARSLVTLPPEKLTTQIDEPSKATPTGSFPTGKVPSNAPSLARILVTVLAPP